MVGLSGGDTRACHKRTLLFRRGAAKSRAFNDYRSTGPLARGSLC